MRASFFLVALILACLACSVAATPKLLPTQVKGTINGVALKSASYSIKGAELRDGKLFLKGNLKVKTATGAAMTAAVENEVLAITKRHPAPLQRRLLQLTCDVLDLEIGAIDLDLLGLQLHIDPINIEITADPTDGLLGQLLCALANLLGSIDLTLFTDLLVNLLNFLVGSLTV